jgi:hypothetical protein
LLQVPLLIEFSNGHLTVFPKLRVGFVGTSNYPYVSPLGFAVGDAEAIAELVTKEFRLVSENVVPLMDKGSHQKQHYGPKQNRLAASDWR